MLTFYTAKASNMHKSLWKSLKISIFNIKKNLKKIQKKFVNFKKRLLAHIQCLIFQLRIMIKWHFYTFWIYFSTLLPIWLWAYQNAVFFARIIARLSARKFQWSSKSCQVIKIDFFWLPHCFEIFHIHEDKQPNVAMCNCWIFIIFV